MQKTESARVKKERTRSRLGSLVHTACQHSKYVYLRRKMKNRRGVSTAGSRLAIKRGTLPSSTLTSFPRAGYRDSISYTRRIARVYVEGERESGIPGRSLSSFKLSIFNARKYNDKHRVP